MEGDRFFGLLKAQSFWIERALIDNHQSPQVIIEQVKSPQTDDEFKSAIRAWDYFLANKAGWQDINCTGNNFPLIFEFDEEVQAGVKFLPLSIEMNKADGKTTYVKRYHRFYFPDLLGSDWSKCLATFLAPRYEEVSDMGLKEFIARSVFELIDVKKGLVLDIGCGPGFSHWWKPSDVKLYGVDISQEMINIAVSNGEHAFIEDFVDPIFEEKHKEEFDGAIIVYVDNWLRDEEREVGYKNICSSLKSKAKIAINIYQPREDWQEYYSAVLTRAGFSKINFVQKETNSKEGVREINFIVAEK